MIAWHGSCHNFQKFRISRALTSESSLQNEGMGIYFSTDRSVAEAYGRYIYTIEINDRQLKDFRTLRACRKYISDMLEYARQKTGIDLSDIIDIENIAVYIHEGQIAVSGAARETELILDSSAYWYSAFSETARTRALQSLRAFENKNLAAYLLPETKYGIKGCGIIRKATPEVVTILSKKLIGR